MPSYLEEAEIEDASKISIDWLINIKELKSMKSDNKSATMDNTLVISFSEKSFFSANATTLNQEEDFLGDNHSLLALQDLDTINYENNDNSQHTIDVEVQGR